MIPKKVYIKTWGCQMNEYDSKQLVNLLTEGGTYQVAATPEEADLLLLNTCSIREKAQEKLFHQLGRWKQLKVNKPGLKIGVGGCVATQEGLALQKRAPYIDVIFGPQTLHRLPQLLEMSQQKNALVADVSFPEIEKFDVLPAPKAEGPIASLSIMEGCDKYCSYCIVPYTRGREISRPLEAILLEATQLIDQGVREITLLGQNVNAWSGCFPDGQHCSFAMLLRCLSGLSELQRIRFITSHPLEFTDELIEIYQDLPQLASFLHLPIQSGSDRILNEMRRGYTVLEYKSILRRLRRVRPDIHFSSDFIVGFPGETEADFLRTLQVVEEMDIDHSYSFIYSPRPNTPAADLPDTVSLQQKKERLYRLQSIVTKQVQTHTVAMLNKTLPVLVERVFNEAGGFQLQGRTAHQRLVRFSGSDKLLGQLVPVHITAVQDAYQLLGEVA